MILYMQGKLCMQIFVRYIARICKSSCELDSHCLFSFGTSNESTNIVYVRYLVIQVTLYIVLDCFI